MADLCAWDFGTWTYTLAANGQAANIRLGTKDFLIQQIPPISAGTGHGLPCAMWVPGAVTPPSNCNGFDGIACRACSSGFVLNATDASCRAVGAANPLLSTPILIAVIVGAVVGFLIVILMIAWCIACCSRPSIAKGAQSNSNSGMPPITYAV